MGFSAREQQALDSIKAGLAGSDPDLAARLALFTRLAAGEDMPPRAKVPGRWRRPVRAPRYVRRLYLRLGFQRFALALWLLITVIMITAGVLLSRGGGGQAGCAQRWLPACAASTQAHRPPPAAATAGVSGRYR